MVSPSSEKPLPPHRRAATRSFTFRCYLADPFKGLAKLIAVIVNIATVPTPAQAEESSDNESDVPNYYNIEVLVTIF